MTNDCQITTSSNVSETTGEGNSQTHVLRSHSPDSIVSRQSTGSLGYAV
jgi:hypothetical protein